MIMKSKIDNNAEKALSSVLITFIVIEIIAGIIWCVLSSESETRVVIPIAVTIASVANTIVLSLFANVLSNISFKLDKSENLEYAFYAQMMIGDKDKAKDTLIEWLSKDENFKYLINQSGNTFDKAYMVNEDVEINGTDIENTGIEEENAYTFPKEEFTSDYQKAYDRIINNYKKFFDILNLPFDLEKVKTMSNKIK